MGSLRAVLIGMKVIHPESVRYLGEQEEIPEAESKRLRNEIADLVLDTFIRNGIQMIDDYIREI